MPPEQEVAGSTPAGCTKRASGQTRGERELGPAGRDTRFLRSQADAGAGAARSARAACSSLVERRSPCSPSGPAKRAPWHQGGTSGGRRWRPVRFSESPISTVSVRANSAAGDRSRPGRSRSIRRGPSRPTSPRPRSLPPCSSRSARCSWAVSASPSKTWPCASSWPSWGERCPARDPTNAPALQAAPACGAHGLAGLPSAARARDDHALAPPGVAVVLGAREPPSTAGATAHRLEALPSHRTAQPENPNWGAARITPQPRFLGHVTGRRTVARPALPTLARTQRADPATTRATPGHRSSRDTRARRLASRLPRNRLTHCRSNSVLLVLAIRPQRSFVMHSRSAAAGRRHSPLRNARRTEPR